MFFQFLLFVIAAVGDPKDEFIGSHSNEQYLPFSLIEEKVSAMTGKVYSYDEDYVIAGQEPIRINRVCREGKWTLMPHLKASHQRGYDFCEIIEPNGVSYRYKKALKFKVGQEYWSRLTDSKKDKLLSHGFDIPAFLETARDLFYDSHTQGALQAVGGLCETMVGGGAILLSEGMAASLGWGVMAHGLDHLITGTKTAIYGAPCDTVTSQLFQATEASPQIADLIDNGMSIAGTMGVTGLARAGETAVTNFSLSALSSERVAFNFTESAGKHMYETGRKLPMHILEGIIESPMAVVQDPQNSLNALMHYSQIWRNGRLYNAEVFYESTTNTISHFKYTEKSLGPLKKVSK